MTSILLRMLKNDLLWESMEKRYMPKHRKKRIEGLCIVYCSHKRKESIFVIQYTRVLIHTGKSDDNEQR